MIPSPGDMAIVVRVCGCEGSLAHLGEPVTVTGVHPGIYVAHCSYCDKPVEHVTMGAVSSPYKCDFRYPLEWLMKITPPAQFETTEKKESLHA